MQIAAACLQAGAEARVRRAQPDRFPPTLGRYLAHAYRQWAALHQRGVLGRCWLDDVCCGENSFTSFVRAEMRKLKEHQREHQKIHGRTKTGITGIDMNSLVGKGGKALSRTLSSAKISMPFGSTSKDGSSSSAPEPASPKRTSVSVNTHSPRGFRTARVVPQAYQAGGADE